MHSLLSVIDMINWQRAQMVEDCAENEEGVLIENLPILETNHYIAKSQGLLLRIGLHC